MPTIKIKMEPRGVHEEGWWTDSFEKMKVLPFYQRFLFAPLYCIYVYYLCLIGRPIHVEFNFG